MAFQARTKGGGGSSGGRVYGPYSAKIAKKRAVSKAVSAQKTRLNRPFAPNRATPANLREASKSPDPGPSIMDLLCLHFKDKGHKAKLATYNRSSTGACIQLQINLSDKQPFGGLPGEVIIGFHLYGGSIWYTAPGWPGYNGNSPFQMGTPEDPELIGRMEGTIKIFISGANNLSALIKSAL